MIYRLKIADGKGDLRTLGQAAFIVVMTVTRGQDYEGDLRRFSQQLAVFMPCADLCPDHKRLDEGVAALLTPDASPF